MSLSLVFALVASTFLLIVFLIGNRVRGIRLALVAAGLALAGMLALYAAMVMLITSSM